MLSRISLILFLGLSLLFTSCSDVTDAELTDQKQINALSSINNSKHGVSTMNSILDIAASNDNFSILAQAVVFADLDEVLDGKRQLTVFAPINAAFEDLLNELGLTAEELFVEENKELVTNILLYHVAPGNRSAEDVVDSEKIRTLSKKFIEVEVNNGSVQIGNEQNGFANVVDTDIFASNGVIHVIDGVLMPPASDRP
jgi:uncharacterized surface protein with fasciclin (FAS1) repeats